METQYIPWAQAEDNTGQVYGRLAPTYFPAYNGESPVVLHQITAYNRDALWNRAQKWFKGGRPAATPLPEQESHRHAFERDLGVGWAVTAPGMKREEREPILADAFIKPELYDAFSLSYATEGDLAPLVEGSGGKLIQLPEFYRRELSEKDKPARWVAVSAAEVPKETELHGLDFSRQKEAPPQIYSTPDSPDSCWKTPGPVSGPFCVYPGDGSLVTYHWYRFCDQPAIVQSGMSIQEREELQQNVEEIHRNWKHTDSYLAPPERGTLASIDPALIVEPPQGFEVGYVPIVTRQEPAQ
jgi:hypothetical protein